MEQLLSQHPWVKTSRLLCLDKTNKRCAAVIILNKTGNDLLIDKGKRFVNQELLNLPQRKNRETLGYPDIGVTFQIYLTTLKEK